MPTPLVTTTPKTPTSDFRVDRQADGGFLLHVIGKMPMDWVSNLTSGLAHNGLSISNAQISSRGGMTWHGHFSLTPAVHATPPGQIDYILLVRSASSRALPAIVLDSFVLHPTTQHGGTLFLEIRGRDQLGFLGTLLNKLSFYSLFPVHMEIETTGSQLLDRFWLSGAGGGQACEAIVAALRSTLQRMVTVAS